MAAASEIEICNSNGKHIGSVSVARADMTAAEFWSQVLWTGVLEYTRLQLEVTIILALNIFV